jgi:hypothetical protein
MGVDKLQHAASHAMGGTDPINPVSIGAVAAALIYSGGTNGPNLDNWIGTWSGSDGILFSIGNYIYCTDPKNLLMLDVSGDAGMDGQLDFTNCRNLTDLVLGIGDPIWRHCSVTVPPVITGLTRLRSLDLTDVPIAESSAVDALVIALSANATAGSVTGGLLSLAGDSPPAQPTLSSVEVQHALSNLALTLGWTITLQQRTVFDLAIDRSDNALVSYTGFGEDLEVQGGLRLSIIGGDGFTPGDYVLQPDDAVEKMRTDRPCGVCGSTGGIATLALPSP